MGALIKNKRRVLAACLTVFVAMLFVAIVAPAKAYAGQGERQYVRRWWDEESKTVKQETKTAWCKDIDEGDDAEIGDGWYITGEDDDDIDTVYIKEGATVNIIVKDGTEQQCEGIYVPESSTLNIYGQSGDSGELRSRSDENCYAGIGGQDYDNGNNPHCGVINIYGGKVYAWGQDNWSGTTSGGAGIGGGYKGAGGPVTIFGGYVEAYGSSNAAGIGGGDEAFCGVPTTIYGGEVKAYGGSVSSNGGAGIGGGNEGYGSTVVIWGGKVTAQGGADAAGIGGGDGECGGYVYIYGGEVNATGGSVTNNGGAGIGGGGDDGRHKNYSYPVYIHGGKVTAQGGADAAGIGGGDGGHGESVTITGGTVVATGKMLGAGIGGGDGGYGSSVTITGGKVTASGGQGYGANAGGAGIGGGWNGAGGNVTISGGHVIAKGGEDAAGIGGGEGGDCNRAGTSIVINGGKVEAYGSVENSSTQGGAGIGGGQHGSGGNVTINDGEVVAKGGPEGAGIGGGQHGKNGGNVNITGGTVTATGGKDAAGIGGGRGDLNSDDKNNRIDRGGGANVTITGGTVTATGGEDAAGIGSGEEGRLAGTVVIGAEGSSDGPTVTATGGTRAAGIGSGNIYPSGNTSNGIIPTAANVTIYSGTVTATGGENGTGIGGGHGCSGGTTIIKGGAVTATAGNYAAGIGSGCKAEETINGGQTQIDGGVVIAKGGENGAGIGGADGVSGEVKITGGSTYATAGMFAAGIGGGKNGAIGRISITGGFVSATGGGGNGTNEGGAGIGSGASGQDGSSNSNNEPIDYVTISGNANVIANGGDQSAGIGGGYKCAYPGAITINGGTVQATGSDFAAGIGGGYEGRSGTITITGGTVTAKGGKRGGSGIGSGAWRRKENDPSVVSVTISGGTVKAYAGAVDGSGYACGVAIGAGGTSFFTGTIDLRGDARIDAYGATNTSGANSDLTIVGKLNAIGTSGSFEYGGKVYFNGATVYMYPGSYAGSASRAVGAKKDNIHFLDEDTADGQYQHVWYMHSDERVDTTDASQRRPALWFFDYNDAGYYPVVVEPGERIHLHKFNYSDDSPTITAECTNTFGECILTNKKATLTIVAPQHKKYDDGKDANATIDDDDTYPIQGDAQVVYYNTISGNRTGDALAAAPTDAGMYWAQITLGPGIDGNTATAHVVYTIAKADNPAHITETATVGADGKTIDLMDCVDNEGDLGVTFSFPDGGDNLGCTLTSDGKLTTGSATGTVNVTVTVAGDNNHDSQTKTIAVTVTANQPWTINADDVTAVYGDTGKSIQPSVTDLEDKTKISYAVKSGSEEYLEVSPSSGEQTNLTLKKAGTAYVTVAVEAGNTHEATTETVKVTISPKPITIKATDETIAKGATPEGEYTVTGLVDPDTLTTPPTLAYTTSDNKRINPSTAVPGTYTITPSSADAGSNYTIAYETGTLTITGKKPSPVNVVDTATVAVGGKSIDLMENVTKNEATGDVHFVFAEGTDTLGCTLAADGKLTSANATGSVTVNVTVDADDTYEALSETPIVVSVVPAVSQVIEADSAEVTYGGTGTVSARVVYPTTDTGEITYAVAEGYQGFIEVDEHTGALTVKEVPWTGIAYVTATAAATSTCAQTTANITVRVNQAPLLITALDKEIYVGQEVPSLDDPVRDVDFKAEGLLSQDEEKVIYVPMGYELNDELIEEEDVDNTKPGEYAIVPYYAFFDDDSAYYLWTENYDIHCVSGKLKIRRGIQTVTAHNMQVTYGDTGKFVKASTTGDGALSYEVTDGDAVSVDATTGELKILKAGGATIKVTASETSAYAAAETTMTVTVAKKQATIQADDKTMQISSTTLPDLTATVSGTVNSDELVYLLAYDTSTEAVAGKTYPITVSFDENENPNSNYEITATSGVLTVTNTSISVSASGWNGAYDGEEHGITVNVTNPDDILCTVTYGTTEGAYDTNMPTQTNAGTLTVYYQVTATSTDGTGTIIDTITGSKDVIVEKAPITPAVYIRSWNWGQNPYTPILDGNPGDGTVTYEYARKGDSNWSTDVPSAYGDYIVRASVAETQNYLGGTAMAEFSILAVEGTLTFDLGAGTLDGQTGVHTMRANCGDTVNLPGAPTKDGYTFDGWDCDGSRYAAGAEFTVDGNRIFTAIWTSGSPDPEPSKNATLAFDPADGTVIGTPDVLTIEVPIGGSIKMPTPVRDGYTFKNWKDSEGNVYGAGAVYTVAGDCTFTAVWEKADPAPTPEPTPTPTPAPTKPAKASKPSTVAHPAAGTIDASWKAVKDAKSYELSWRVADGWVTLSTKQTSYTITSLKAGSLYDIRMRAVNGSAKGAWSKVNHRWLKGVTKVRAATGKAKGSVKVSWKKDKKATGGYKVLVYAKKDGKLVKTKVVSKAKASATIKGLKSGKTYYVRVRPYHKKGSVTYVGALSGYRAVKAK